MTLSRFPTLSSSTLSVLVHACRLLHFVRSYWASTSLSLSPPLYLSFSLTLSLSRSLSLSLSLPPLPSLSLSLSRSLIFRLSVSGRCYLDGSSIQQLIFCCSSHSPDTCRHRVLHILLLIKYQFGLPMFLLPFTFPSGINLSMFGVVLYIRNKLTFAF